VPALDIITGTSNGDSDGNGTDANSFTTECETASALLDGISYLVLYDGGANMDGTPSDGAECQLEFDGVEHGFSATNGFAFNPPDGGVARPLSGATIIEGDGSETVTIQCRHTGTTGVEYMWQGGSLICIPLDQLTRNRDYWFGGGGTVGNSSTLGVNSTTAVLTPASSAAWAQIGTAVRVTAVETGPHLIVLTAEAQYQSDANADEIRLRPRQTSDVGGSPTTATMGVGSGGGTPEIRIQGRASDAETESNSNRYSETVTLTAGVTYDFFLEAEGVNGDVEYRRARYIVVDGSAFGEMSTFEDTTGVQEAAPTTTVVGPLTIADPGTAYDYVVIASTSFQNNGSWHQMRIDLDGTDNVTNGGRGSAGSNNGTATTDDYHWLSMAWPVNIPATSTPDYEINLSVTITLATDCPIGFEPGGEAADSIRQTITAWRMEVIRLNAEVDASLLLPTMAASATVTGSANNITMDAALPLPVMDTAAVAGTQATIDTTLPIPTATIDARILVEAAMDADLPLPLSAILATVATSAAMDADLPLPLMDAAAVTSSVLTAAMDADLPLPVMDAAAIDATATAMDAALPMPVMDAVTSRGLSGAMDADLPLPTADIAAGIVGEVTMDAALPLPVMDATTVRALSGAMDADLLVPVMAAGAIIVGAPTNAVLDANLPLPTMDAVTTSGLAAAMDADLPIPTAMIAATAAHLAAMDADLLVPTMDTATVVATAVAMDADLPVPTMAAATVRAASGALDATLLVPTMVAVANVTLPPEAAMDADLPMPVMDAVAAVLIDAAMDADLPLPTMDAIVAAMTSAALDASLPLPLAAIATAALPNITMDAALPLPVMDAVADAPPLPGGGGVGGSLVWTPELRVPEAVVSEVWAPEVWATRAGGDILAALGDTFGGASLDPSWTVEDINAALDGASGVSGGEYNLRMSAGGAAGSWWSDDNAGILIYKEIVGPFMMRCRVRVRNDADSGAPPTGALGKYCGLAAHDPDRTALNYVHLVAGSDVAASVEWQTTDAIAGGSTDTTARDPLTAPPNGTVEIDLQLVRRASDQQIFDLSYRDATGGHTLANDVVPFTALQTIDRTDNTTPGRAASGAAADVAVSLPARLRVGMVGYSVQAADDVQGFFEEIIVSRDHPSIT